MPDNTEKAPTRNGVATSIRLSPLGLRLWNKLAETQGVNRTAYLEMLLRQTAEQKGISGEGEAASE